MGSMESRSFSEYSAHGEQGGLPVFFGWGGRIWGGNLFEPDKQPEKGKKKQQLGSVFKKKQVAET